MKMKINTNNERHYFYAAKIGFLFLLNVDGKKVV